MPIEPPKDKSRRPPIPGQTQPKCRRCQSTQVQMMGRMGILVRLGAAGDARAAVLAAVAAANN